MCLFGAIAVIATETPIEADVMPAFMAKLVEDQNEVTVVVLPLLLVGMFAIALSAMMSMFSAGLCTIRFDILPLFWSEPASSKAENDETIAIRRTIIAGAGFFLTVVISFFLADALLRVGFGTSAFLALLVAFCCAQFSFAPLVLGPMLLWASGDLAAVSPQWALTVMGCSVASAAAGRGDLRCFWKRSVALGHGAGLPGNGPVGLHGCHDDVGESRTPLVLANMMA
jgi:hypothetical protein